MSKLSAFRTHPEEHIPLQLKEELMLQRITKAMVIQPIVYFTIPLKVVITGPVKQMFIDLQRFPRILLINALLKVFHLLETMGDYLITDHLEEFWSRELFMLKDKQVSNYY